MTGKEESKVSQEQQLQTKEAQPQPSVEKVAEAVKAEALDVLNEFGGYEIVSTTVEGAENMDPGQVALRDIFLTEKENEDERNKLKKRLGFWLTLITSVDNVGEMIEKSQETSQQSEQLLNANLKKALDATTVLETNYRTVATFYQNAAGDKPVKNVTIVNASMEKIADKDNPRVRQLVGDELRDKFDRLDLMNNYGMVVIPGWLGNKQIIDEWGRVCSENKAMLLTDYRNLETPAATMKLFEKDKLTGADNFKSNIMITCNWLVGRGMISEAGEKEPLFIPPSAAQAGRLYDNNIGQVSAGKKYGVLRGISGTRFDIRANDLSDLGDLGLVPTVYEFGQVQAFSARTLFNGSNAGLQTYSVVRTFDWLTKSMMDYLNRMLYRNISVNMEMDITKEVSKFLDRCQREGKVIEKFGKVDVKRDPNQKDRVFVSVNITPFFPAKNFVIFLDGKSGEDGSEWDSKVE
jgi:Type VI secretion system, TssC, VipB